MPTLHLLLTAITAYPNPADRLPRAVPDAQALLGHLQGCLAPGWRLSTKTLFNHQATKQNIIASFSSHFGQAAPDDVCLFYFGGHGSKLEAPPEELDHFALQEGSFETLVAYDSRQGGGDLVDKELAQLIGEVNQRVGFRGNGHLVTILDCCHSGDGSKDELATTPETTRTVVPLWSMPIGHFYGYRGNGYPLRGNHVNIAACGPEENAVDGVFMANLLQLLQTGAGSGPYQAIGRGLAGQVRTQRPRVEATPAGLSGLPFLGGAVG